MAPEQMMVRRSLFAFTLGAAALVGGASSAGAPPDNAADLACSAEAYQDCIASSGPGCASCLEEQVEQAERALVEGMRTELLQVGAQQFKGPARVRRTPAGALLAAALGTGAPAAAAAAAVAGGVALGGAAHELAPPPKPGAAVHSEHGAAVHIAGHSSDENYMAQAAIPVGAFVLGAFVMMAGQRTAGMLAVYFGAQSGFSLYMKLVLSNAIVSRELHLKGVPAAFLVTAIQQVVAFGILSCMLVGLWVTPKEWLNLSEPYRPKQLRTSMEWIAMLVFAVAFAANIGLNNFSLSLLTVSLNLIIRSCLPLVALIMQLITGTAGPIKLMEVLLMVAGVVFAGLATVAKGTGSHGGAGTKHLILGVLMCSASDIAAALNLVLASIFGTRMKLNPLDTTFYMALPCAASLLPAVFLLSHPVEWPGFGTANDWEVFKKVLELSPRTLVLVGVSGIFAAGYNLLQYALVQSLSATHAAFAGNFNKAATIMLSIFLGLESLPGGVWSGVMLFAIVGNIASFTGYSLLKAGEGKHSPPAGEAKGLDTQTSNLENDATINKK